MIEFLKSIFPPRSISNSILWCVLFAVAIPLLWSSCGNGNLIVPQIMGFPESSASATEPREQLVIISGRPQRPHGEEPAAESENEGLMMSDAKNDDTQSKDEQNDDPNKNKDKDKKKEEEEEEKEQVRTPEVIQPQSKNFPDSFIILGVIFIIAVVIIGICAVVAPIASE